MVFAKRPDRHQELIVGTCYCTETAEGAAAQSAVPAGIQDAVLGTPGHYLILDSAYVCCGTGALIGYVLTQLLVLEQHLRQLVPCTHTNPNMCIYCID